MLARKAASPRRTRPASQQLRPSNKRPGLLHDASHPSQQRHRNATALQSTLIIIIIITVAKPRFRAVRIPRSAGAVNNAVRVPTSSIALRILLSLRFHRRLLLPA